jgi:Cu+-exporting ATPase
VGRPSSLAEAGVDLTPISGGIGRLESEGFTAIAIGRDGQPLGVIGLAETIRRGVRDAIERMRADGLIPVLVTGDNRPAAEHVAARLGIEEVRRLELANQVGLAVGKHAGVRPAAASGMPMPLNVKASTTKIVVTEAAMDIPPVLSARDISRAAYRRVRQNDSIAISVPPPIAMPTSACVGRETEDARMEVVPEGPPEAWAIRTRRKK